MSSVVFSILALHGTLPLGLFRSVFYSFPIFSVSPCLRGEDSAFCSPLPVYPQPDPPPPLPLFHTHSTPTLTPRHPTSPQALIQWSPQTTPFSSFSSRQLRDQAEGRNPKCKNPASSRGFKFLILNPYMWHSRPRLGLFP